MDYQNNQQPINGTRENGEGRQEYYYPPVPPETINPIEKEANVPSGLFMVASVFLFSLFFSNMFLRGGLAGISVPVCISLFYVIVIWYLKGRNNAFSRNSLIMLVLIEALSFTYLFESGFLAWFVTTLTLLFMVPAQLTVMSGASLRTMFSPRIIPETWRLAVKKTFCYLYLPFRSFRVLNKVGASGRKICMAIIGLLCAVPFLFLFGALFSSADAVFAHGIKSIYNALGINFSSCVFDLFFGVIITIMLSSFLFVLRGTETEEKEMPVLKGKLNTIATSVFLVLILIFQGAFILTQFVFLFGETPLPVGISYGEYVHAGFFQIAVASIITAIIIISMSMLGKRNANGSIPIITKTLLTLLTLFDFALYFCAYTRMYHYIQAYDLSVNRIGVCWLMALMGLIIGGATLKMWLPKINVAGWAICCSCVMVLLLNGINPDRMTARYNVSQYLTEPESSHFDIAYLQTLSPSVVPELNKLKNTPIQAQAEEAMEHLSHRMENRNWKNAKLTDSKIREILSFWNKK